MELEIHPKPRPGGTRSTRRRVRRKGRRFRAFAAGWIEAPALFVGPGLGRDRVPIWIGLASTEASLRPFQANLRSGATAIEIDNSRQTLSLPTEIEYRSATQSHRGIVTLTLWHAALELEPAPGEQEAEQIRFVLRLRESWIAAQGRPEDDIVAESLAQVLGRRIRLPIPASPEFRRLLFRRLLAKGYLSSHDAFRVVGSPPACRLVGCNVNRSLLRDLLQDLTADTT